MEEGWLKAERERGGDGWEGSGRLRSRELPQWNEAFVFSGVAATPSFLRLTLAGPAFAFHLSLWTCSIE